MKNKPLDNFYLLSCLLLFMWGSYAAVNKLALGSLSVFQVQFYGYGVAFVIMSALNIRKIKTFKEFSFEQWRIMLLCALFACSYVFLYTLSLEMADESQVTTVVMINYLFPVFVTLFSVPVNKEKPGAKKILAMFVSLAGAFAVVGGNEIASGGGISFSRDGLLMYLLVFTAAMCWGMFSALGKKNDAPVTASNLVIVAVGFAASAIFMLAFSRFAVPDTKTFAMLIWLGTSNFIFSVFIWIKLLKKSEAVKAATLSLITPFSSLLFIRLLLPETAINIYHGVGLAVILAGVWLQKPGE